MVWRAEDLNRGERGGRGGMMQCPPRSLRSPRFLAKLRGAGTNRPSPVATLRAFVVNPFLRP
jgi:hypothetical protein